MNDVLRRIRACVADGEPRTALSLARQDAAAALDDPEFLLLWAALEYDHGNVAESVNLALQLVRQGVTGAVRLGTTVVPPWVAHAALLLGACAERRADWRAAVDAYAVASFIDPALVPLLVARCTAWHADAGASAIVENFAVDRADIVCVTGGLTTPLADPPPWTLFDGTTPERTSLGGSESALIAMAQAWAAEGRQVVAFTPCLQTHVVHGVTYRPNAEYFLAVALAGVRRVIVSRNQWYLRDVPAVAQRHFWVHDAPDVAQYSNWQWSAAQCARVVCVSQTHAASWQTHFSLPSDIVRSVSNGFALRYFPPDNPASRVLQMVYISRPERGLDVALAAFAQLRAQLPALTLHVATYDPTGESKSVAEQYAAKQATDGVVWHTGLSKPALAQLLRASRALFYPNTSTAETSCMVAIEAMAAGCPVICSDRGALPETVIDGVGGVIVPYDSDHQQLAQQLVAAALPILTDDARWRALSNSAFAHAHARYEWDVVAARWWSELLAN